MAPDHGGREDRGLEEAREAPGRPGRRDAPGRGRASPRPTRPSRSWAKTVGRGGEPEAGEADGRRVERHGARGVARRQGRALHVRRRRPARDEDQVRPAPRARSRSPPWLVLGRARLPVRPARPSSTTWRAALPSPTAGRRARSCCSARRRPSRTWPTASTARPAGEGRSSGRRTRPRSVSDLAAAGGARGRPRPGALPRGQGPVGEVRLNGAPRRRLRAQRPAAPLPACRCPRRRSGRARTGCASCSRPRPRPPTSIRRDTDRRQLAAAFYSLTVRGRGRRRPRRPARAATAPDPFAVDRHGRRPGARPGRAQRRPLRGAPSSRRPSCASRPSSIPRPGRRRRRPSFRVTIEARPGDERELWARVLGPRDGKPGRGVGRAAGRRRATSCASASHVGGAPGARFTWGDLDRAARPRPRRQRPARARRRHARRRRAAGDSLRQALAGSNVVARGPRRRARPGVRLLRLRPRPPRRRSTASPREGVVFERAFTPAVYTLAAMSSVWTSQYPDRHHGEVSFSARLPKDRLTLAEILTAAGHPDRRLRGQRGGGTRGRLRSRLRGVPRAVPEVRQRRRTRSGRRCPRWLQAQQGPALLRLRPLPRAAFPVRSRSRPSTRASGRTGPSPRRRAARWAGSRR